ncbi:MAG: hypothetical protein KKH75_01530 [Actinobacteria bacterium]|nr:hypothetical protein [Actinomycetota bacterium]
MEWTADVSAGDWLRDRLDVGLTAGMHSVVPRGFDAYVRVFHPAGRDRPVGRSWPGLPRARHAREWEKFQADTPEIDVQRSTWAQAAEAFGTTMHNAQRPRRHDRGPGPRSRRARAA